MTKPIGLRFSRFCELHDRIDLLDAERVRLLGGLRKAAGVVGYEEFLLALLEDCAKHGCETLDRKYLMFVPGETIMKLAVEGRILIDENWKISLPKEGEVAKAQKMRVRKGSPIR